MYNSKLPKANKFIRKRKRMSLWHRLLVFAGSIVVFVTTYMLILPAITAEIGTLNIHDECISSSGIEIEEATDAANAPETPTEKDSSLSGSGSGGGGSSSNVDGVLPDGTVINVKLDEVEIEQDKDKEEEKGFLNKIINAASELLDGATVSTKGSGEGGKYVCVYDPETGDFAVDLVMDFSIPQGALSDDTHGLGSAYSKSYVVDLPKDILVPKTLLRGWYVGMQTGTTNEAFQFCYEPVEDSEGNIINYRLVMVYLDSFLDTLNGSSIEGTVQLQGQISSTAYQEDGTIKITDKEKGFDINIDKDDVQFNDNETVHRDINVIKEGSYNASDNTITYTVTAYTKKGMGDTLTIKDNFTDSSLLTELGAVLESVEYKQGTIGVNEASYGTSINDNYTTYTENASIPAGSDGSVHYQKNEDGTLEIVLPGLTEAEEGPYSPNEWEKDYVKANAYKITYKYKIEPKKGVTYRPENKAIAEVYENDIKIQDETSKTVTISGRNIINKTGYLSNNEIKWTITVGDKEDSVGGYILKDEMFKDLTEEEIKAAIKKDGNTAPDTDYEILIDDEGKIIGIQFKEGADKQYTIEYSTSVTEEWKNQNITNKAEVTDGDDTFDSTANVGIPGKNGCFNKVLNDAVLADESNSNIYNLSWTTKFNIPNCGIPAGVTYEDYLEGSSHYYTYAQAQEIIANLQSTWGAENIKDIQFFNGENPWTWGAEWINADAITDGTKYYQFRYTFANDIPYDTEDEANNVKEYTYHSTVDISTVKDSVEYKNNMREQGGNTKTAVWKYDKKVVKYALASDGSLKGNGVEVSTNNGMVRWVVKLALDSAVNNYTITDNLPAGVILEKLSVSKYNSNDYQEVSMGENESSSLFDDQLEVIYNSEGNSETGQKIILNANVDKSTYGCDYIYIKYECKIDDPEKTTEDKVYNLANKVNVEINGSTPYGDDSNTQSVKWIEETQEDENLTKNAQFDKNNNIIEYSLDINPNGEMYTIEGEEYSYIKLEDTLSYMTFPSKGFIRDASLMLNSVKLYYAKKDSDGNILKEDGRLVKGEEVDTVDGDALWSYTEKRNNADWGDTVTKYINLKIPNGTPLVFEYKYVVRIVQAEGSEGSTWNTSAEVTNGAKLYIGNQLIEEIPGKTEYEKIEDSGTSGQANGGSGYTIYKVDKDNFALTLDGATFDLYVYNNETGEFENKGGVTTVNGRAAFLGTPDKDLTEYDVKLSNDTICKVPVNTMCYFVESNPPEGYKLDKTKNYFFFGKTAAFLAQDCSGYDGTDPEMTTAINAIVARTAYIRNEHSAEYFAEKTRLTVLKRWLNAKGEDITSAKADGSVKFKLMRVFTPRSGSGGDSGSGSGGDTPSSDSKKLNVDIKANYANYLSNDSSSAVYDERFPQNCKAGTKISFTVRNPYAKADWANWSINISANDIALEPVITDDPSDSNAALYTYTFTVNEDTSLTGDVMWNPADIAITDVTIEGNGSDETIESTTESSAEETTATGDGVVIHEHNFSTDGDEFGIPINTDVSGGSVYHDGFFTITGNLSNTHGTATYEVGGEPAVLDTCLKMQSYTTIKFTAKKSGVLTLVFNENGNGNETTPITSNCQIDGATFSAYDNYIKRAVTAGEHIITKRDTCYLFYMSFEENGTLAGSDIYKHSFDDGLGNRFFLTKENGSLATNKGIVTYQGQEMNTCLKMNSKAEIAINPPFDGTLYMLITNPNGAAKVGVSIDGVEHYAVQTGLKDSKDNPVYLLPARVSRGEHTIKRINSTEVMLYYLEYMPDDDDYGNAELTPEAPNNPNAVCVDASGNPDENAVHTISASGSWTKMFTNLPWQVIDEESGDTLGYYSYYVVEVDNTGFITQYKNSIPEGIASGTVGIYNQEEDNGKELRVTKKWLNADGQDESDSHDNDHIEFGLYRKVNLNEGAVLDTTRSEPHNFVSYNSNFYTITSNNGSYDGTYGYAMYDGNKYTSCMKTESKSSVKFTAPAKGKLTLVFGSKPNYNPESETNTFNNQIGFVLQHNGKKTSYIYDLDNPEQDVGCQFSYSDAADDRAAIFTVDLEEGGEYEIVRASKVQCYLYYMDYTYKVADALDGIKIGQYTIDATDVDENGNTWTKVISSLPADIKDKDNNIIGYYSYYVVETSPSSGYNTTITYEQTDGDNESVVYNEITSGKITITNQRESNFVLPETGGHGTNKYTMAGLLLCVAAGFMLFKRCNGKFLT